MRILLCANRDLMAALALNHLLPSLAGHEVDMILSDGVGKAAKPPEILAWNAFEREVLRDLPVLRREIPGAEGFLTFEELAEASGAGEAKTFASINKDDGLAHVAGFAPDVILSLRFGQIFKAPVLSLPRLGVLNLHSGVLPDYRGVLATFWAMLNREARIGCTLHRIDDATIDTGGVVDIHERPARYDRSVAWNVASLYRGGTETMAAAVSTLASGRRLTVRPQDAGQGAYFSSPGPQDVRAFLEAGGVLFSAADYREILASSGAAHA